MNPNEFQPQSPQLPQPPPDSPQAPVQPGANQPQGPTAAIASGPNPYSPPTITPLPSSSTKSSAFRNNQNKLWSIKRTLVSLGILLIVTLACLVYFAAKAEPQKPKPDFGPTLKQAIADNAAPPSTNPKANTSKTVCDVFTLNDARALIGKSAIKGSESPPREKLGVRTFDCTYTSDSDSIDLSLDTSISPDGDLTIDTWWSSIASTAGLKTVPDVGDEAYCNSNTKSLFVKKGRVIFLVTEKGNDLKLMISVAKTIMSNF